MSFTAVQVMTAECNFDIGEQCQAVGIEFNLSFDKIAVKSNSVVIDRWLDLQMPVFMVARKEAGEFQDGIDSIYGVC